MNGGRNYNGPKVAKFLVGQVPTRTNGVTSGALSQRGSGEIEISVKMRITRSRTKRPRGALLQLGIVLELDLRSIGGRLRTWASGLGGVGK